MIADDGFESIQVVPIGQLAIAVNLNMLHTILYDCSCFMQLMKAIRLLSP